MSKVIISTDSPADIGTALAEKWGVAVIPLHVILNGEDRLDGVDVTPEEIVENYKATKALPSTFSLSRRLPWHRGLRIPRPRRTRAWVLRRPGSQSRCAAQ